MTADPFVILYVEDNDFIRESFAELLATDDRQIIGVANGAAAREVLRQQRVSLLLTDIHLPDGSGLDVAREALDRHPGLPVVICSGDDLSGVPRALGPSAHSLKKPFDLDELETLLDQLTR